MGLQDIISHHISHAMDSPIYDMWKPHGHRISHPLGYLICDKWKPPGLSYLSPFRPSNL
jgi:hypothetical protein